MSTYFRSVGETRQRDKESVYPVTRPAKLKGLETHDYHTYFPLNEVGTYAHHIVSGVETLLRICHDYGIDFDALWDERCRAERERREPDYNRILRLLGADIPTTPLRPKCDSCGKEGDLMQVPVLAKSICTECLRQLREAMA